MEKILSWLENFKSFFSSEVQKISSAQAELLSVRAALDKACSDLNKAAATINDLDAKLKAAEESAAKNTEEIKSLQTKLTEAENKATETLSAQGIRADELPKASLQDAGAKTANQQVEALRERIKSSADPKEKYKLSTQIKELLSKKN